MSYLNIITFLIFLISSSKCIQKPIFMFELFRHGARSPITLDEQSKDSYGFQWSSPEQLTLVGRRMHFILGYRNNERYIQNMNFLSKTFNPHEILLISSNINRTIESAFCHLQGLYPSDYNMDIKLNEKQINNSNPPINITKDIEEEINKLNLIYAPLPGFISTIPFHIYHDLERKINFHKSNECYETVRPIKEKNLELHEVQNVLKEFNNKYKNSFNNFLKQKGDYSFPNIATMCDQYISDYIDGRNLTFFEKYNISVDGFYNFCIDVAQVDFKDYLFGDKEKNVVQLAISPIFNQMLVYLKNRVNADINNVTIDSNLNDFSNPKFFMISAHDSTIWGLEIFLNEAFKKSYKYIKPTFASSIFIEVYKINENATTYNDYEVHYIMNDIIIDKYKLNDFLNVTQNKIWNQKRVLDFCKVKINNTSYTKTIIIIILCIVLLVLIVFIVMLSIKLSKKQKINFKLNEEST